MLRWVVSSLLTVAGGRRELREYEQWWCCSGAQRGCAQTRVLLCYWWYSCQLLYSVHSQLIDRWSLLLQSVGIQNRSRSLSLEVSRWLVFLFIQWKQLVLCCIVEPVRPIDPSAWVQHTQLARRETDIVIPSFSVCSSLVLYSRWSVSSIW